MTICTRGRTRRPPRRLVYVSPAEMRVLEALLVDGADNLTLARRLDLDPETVASHLKRLYRATGCHGKAPLVVAALRGDLNFLVLNRGARLRAPRQVAA